MWAPKTKFEFEWRRLWDHEDMCLISYLYLNSKNTCLIISYFDCNSRDMGRDSRTLINKIVSHLFV